MAKREPIDVICQHSQDGSIVPLKIRVRDDDGEYQAYMIQGFRRQDVVKGSGEYGLPAHGRAGYETETMRSERRGGITTKDGVYINSHVTVYECQITTFGHKRRIRLYYNEESGIWSMCG